MLLREIITGSETESYFVVSYSPYALVSSSVYCSNSTQSNSSPESCSGCTSV